MCLIVLASSSRCVHKSTEKIPEGVYQEPSKIERLDVGSEEIVFHLILPRGLHPGTLVDRKCEYSLLTSNELRIWGSSNDEAFVFGVLHYTWSWDGTNIVRKARQTGEKAVFAREATPVK